MDVQTPSGTAWSANEMKKLTREIFDEDGDKMLTIGLFGRRSTELTSPLPYVDSQNVQANMIYESTVRKLDFGDTNVEYNANFRDDSSGVTDVSVSVGSESSYSNDSYNSYEGNRKNACLSESSPPRQQTPYKEVCSLKYDPKIRCRCSACKSKMTPAKSNAMSANTQRGLDLTSPPIRPLTEKNLESNPLLNKNGSYYNGNERREYNSNPSKDQSNCVDKEDEINSIRRNARQYRSYTPKSQKAMRQRRLQQGRDEIDSSHVRKPYNDDFDVSYVKSKREYTSENEPLYQNPYDKSRVQEQTAGYFGEQEGFESFPGNYFEAYSHIYSPGANPNTPNLKHKDKVNQIERLQREYSMRNNGRPAPPGNPREGVQLARELEQIEAEYQQIESKLKKEKFYRRSYIAAQEKDSPKIKLDSVKIPALYKQNGALRDIIRSPQSRESSQPTSPVSTPGSIHKIKSSSGRSTPSDARVTSPISPKISEEVTSPKQSRKLSRTTSFRKSNKKREKLSRSKSFSEGDRKKRDGSEGVKSPDESFESSPCMPRESPCVINARPVRKTQVYHLDEEDSPEEGLRAVLNQMSKYQNENKAVPLFLNVIQDLRTSYTKLLKEAGKLKEDPTPLPHDIIRKHSVVRKPNYSEAAKRTRDVDDNSDADEDLSSPVTPSPGKIRVNGDELFYKVSLRRKDSERLANKNGDLHENGNTPIHRAAKNGNLDILQVLVLNGGDVNALNAQGWPALHLSLQSYHFRSALFLIEAGADLRDYTGRRVQDYQKVQKMARRYFQYLETEL